MSMRDQLCEAIRAKLRNEMDNMDWDDVIDNVAQTIIEEEIGDVQKAAECHMIEELSDWTRKVGADDILNELIDDILDD